jgi:hypothetical protein
VTVATQNPSSAGACGSLSSTTGPTNANGQFTTTYTTGTAIGSCQLLASETGGPAPHPTATAGVTQTA